MTVSLSNGLSSSTLPSMAFLIAIQVVVSLLLILCILVQHRASGLSATFGGSGAMVIQRRGAEKLLFQATIVFSALFFALTVLQWYV